MSSQLNGYVKKGWGHELIWSTNDKYCGKLLVFEKTGSKFSMHFHKEKDETWFVSQGSFLLKWIDTTTATINEQTLNTGETWRNLPHVPHQLVALEAGSTIIEVSTPDSVEDNFRIFPGDSQT
jgi:quercetin dioxygenase-like cupin family protein